MPRSVHPDHLNTPRAITNATGQLVWAWANDDPFGGNVPDEDPSGLGNFTCNLRLPGQYFDQETNTHYNYFRDYEPGIGRYIQSDPLGITTTLRPTPTTGLNHLYAYVANNPLSYVDPYGLQLSPNLKGQLGSAILDYLTSRAVRETSRALGEAIGAGLKGKTGQQGCRDACTEKCLLILDQATAYFRNDMLFGCLEGCIPKCNECP